MSEIFRAELVYIKVVDVPFSNISEEIFIEEVSVVSIKTMGALVSYLEIMILRE